MSDETFHVKRSARMDEIRDELHTKLLEAEAMVDALTGREQDAIADGEPYCFRCGKPASSFPEYEYQFAGGDNADYVRNQEGTYNPDTNRFACDACYIAIGVPSEPGGWRAP